MKKSTKKNRSITQKWSILSLPFSLTAVAFGVVSFFIPQSNSELAYVDVNKLLLGYERAKVDRETFTRKTSVMKANVDSLMTDWQNELKVYEKERASMTKKELALKQELLQNKQQQINNYQQVVQKQIEQEDQKMTQTVINDINDYVKAYGKEHNHLIIFGAQGNGNIMYADKGTDLTDKILEGLNKQYHGK
ncbi:OmpH family outer membrane protein [Flagellimonas beolgyonensis]|uniref:OmpH family outer membrane protein n=1 Tax=Flagellimonas beolgyonensis TaxID=864064 RepID=UPI003D660F88